MKSCEKSRNNFSDLFKQNKKECLLVIALALDARLLNVGSFSFPEIIQNGLPDQDFSSPVFPLLEVVRVLILEVRFFGHHLRLKNKNKRKGEM